MNRSLKLILVGLFLYMNLGVFAQSSSGVKNPPNILIITVDNVGYGDLSVFNKNSTILTPNLERLAQQGSRLTNFYTAGATCTVSRACLLTGRIARRHKLTYQLPGLAGNYGEGLRTSEIIIPRMLENSEANYATGAFGKWNIGFAPGSRPIDRGFDEYLGIASGNADHFTHVYAGQHDLHHNNQRINRHGEYSTDLFANAAMDFMKVQVKSDRPFMVYLPFDAPHHPGDRNIDPDAKNIWQAPDYAFEPYGISPETEDPKARFNAVVTAVDMAIGRILDHLEDLGIADNTFIFFYSDNGAFYPYLDIQSNAPLKGAGVTLWEGGIRVPAIASFPGRIPANRSLDTRLWSLDLFPTIAHLSRAELPQDRFIDGVNIWDNLTGQNLHSPHATLFFEYKNFSALHWGNWKIIREEGDADWQLYNLKEDIGESQNRAAERPDIVKKLSAAFDLKQAEIDQYLEREDTFQKTH